MKKAKLLIITSIITAMGLIACGRPSRDNSSNSSGGGIVPKDPKIDLVKAHINGLDNFTLSENIISHEQEDEELSVGGLKYQTDANMEIQATVMIGENVNKTVTTMHYTQGIANLTALAESLGISRAALIKNISSASSFEYIDEEKDVAVLQEYNANQVEWSWYSRNDEQYVEYSIEDDGDVYYKYVLDGEGLDIKEVKDALLSIVDNGVYSQEKGGFYLSEEKLEELEVFGDLSAKSAVLAINDKHYPTRLTIDGEEYSSVYFEISNIGNTVVDDKPNPVNPPQCKYRHYTSRYYHQLEGGHRLYCNECDKYLEPKENHTIVNPDGHQFCTKCRKFLNTDSAESGFFKLVDNDTWGYGYQSKDNNRIYISGFYGSSKAKVLRLDSNFIARYYSTYKKLLVFKNYNISDTQLVSAYDYTNLGFSCMKVLRGAIEIFDNVESYEDSTMTNEQYVAFRAAHTPSRAHEVYYVVSNHSTSARETVLSNCEKYVESVCDECHNVTSAYLNTDHHFVYSRVQKIDPDNPCQVRIYKHCDKCNANFQQEERLQSHVNATYVEVDDDYLFLKYGIESDGDHYIEMNCPTCKKQCLIEASSPSHNHASTGDYVNTYEYVNDKLVKDTYVKMIYPHVGEGHICNLENKVVFSVDYLELFFSYNLDSDGNVNSFYYDSYAGNEFYVEGISVDTEYKEDGSMEIHFVEGKPNDLGQLLGTTLAKIVTSADGKDISVLNASLNEVYHVTIGQPLPKKK